MRFKPILLTTIPLLLAVGSAEAAEMKSVRVPSANFREKPSTDAPIMFSADKLYPVEIVKRYKGWARVKDFEGDEAWVAERLLDDTETVVISQKRVNVREKGNTTSDIIFKAERGEVFAVLKREGAWLNVQDPNGEKGWIRDDMTWGEHEAAAEKTAAKEDDEKESSKAKAAPEKENEKEKDDCDCSCSKK